MPISLTNASQNLVPFRDKSADRLRRTFIWNGPASYVTGGEAVNPGNVFGFGQVHVFLAQPPTNGVAILGGVVWDATNSKLKWFDAAGAEIGNATDLSTYSFRAEVIGR